jgi:hypothetical protein
MNMHTFDERAAKGVIRRVNLARNARGITTDLLLMRVAAVYGGELLSLNPRGQQASSIVRAVQGKPYAALILADAVGADVRWLLSGKGSVGGWREHVLTARAAKLARAELGAVR